MDGGGGDYVADVEGGEGLGGVDGGRCGDGDVAAVVAVAVGVLLFDGVGDALGGGGGVECQEG